MSKASNVLSFYVLCNKLKQVIRTGWKNWNVQGERIESVAEHIYGVQMLAIAMKSEYEYDVDIMKVIMMLAVHELGETVIGDITLFDMDKEKKKQREHEAVHKILEGMLDGKKIEQIFIEFDEGNTMEANLAYLCDNVECDLQAKIYGEEGRVDLSNQEDNKSLKDPRVKQLLEEDPTWELMWLRFGQLIYPYDENFKEVSDYAQKHKVKIIDNYNKK